MADRYAAEAQALERAISRVVDAQQAAEKAGNGRTTVSTADLKLVLRMFGTLFREKVRTTPTPEPSP